MRNKILCGVLATIIILLIVNPIQAKDVRDADEDEIDNDVIVETMNEVVRAGTYFIRVGIENDKGQVTSELKRLHIKFPRTKLNYTNEEGIDAHDIVVVPNTFDTLGANEIKTLAGAHAWSMVNGEEVAVSLAEVFQPRKKSNAKNQVKFSTKKGTSVEVSAYEQSEVNMGLDEVYVNKEVVIRNGLSMISIFLIVLTIVPILIYLLLILYMKHFKEKVKTFLYQNRKEA